MSKTDKVKNYSYGTARVRKDASAPSKWLTIRSIVPLGAANLDYGCGRGEDAKIFGWDSYDPHWNPVKPTKKYNFITCTYVLNVVDEATQEKIISTLKRLLTPTGVAFITVRRDVGMFKKKISKRVQRYVKLSLPVVRENCQFCIYEMRRGKKNGD